MGKREDERKDELNKFKKMDKEIEIKETGEGKVVPVLN
jgi:hypothetical protein